MLASLQRQLGQRKVRIGGSGDDHYVDCGVLDHLLRGTERLNTGMILLSIIILLRGALDNCVELEFWDLLHEGNVEDLCAEAVAHNADIISLASHDGL